MGTKERREREKQEVRERILDAARTLFVREGYEAVSMRRIADLIEYSPTAIYMHFEDKDALFRELCGTDFLALAKSFGHLATIADPLERLRGIGREYVRFGLEHPNHYRLMFMTPHPPEAEEETTVEKGNPEQDAYSFLLQTIQQCVAADRFRAEYRDAEQVAQMLWASTHGLVALHITMGGDDGDWVEWRPAMETSEALIDALLRGMSEPVGMATANPAVAAPVAKPTRTIAPAPKAARRKPAARSRRRTRGA